MTQYILTVSSYAGLVPWARHFKGRVEGPHPEPCHGNSTIFNPPEHRGKTVCAEGHELPKQVKWDVEAAWSEARHERYLAESAKALREGLPGPDGPGQFDTEKAVVDRAIVQFLDGLEHVNDPAVEGDELWYGYVDSGAGQAPDQWDDPEDVWGMRIARCQRG